MDLAAERRHASRAWQIEQVETRDADGGVTFRGYASVFNHPYDVHDRFGTFTETVVPGAFTRSLANRGHKIHMLVQHGGVPLASTSSGTLQLREDDHGLAVEASLAPESPLAMTVISAVRRGDMDEMSFGFSVPEGGDQWNDDWSERTVSEAKLFEVSVVDRGANDRTEAMIRALHVDLDDPAQIREAIATLEAKLAPPEPPSGYDPEWFERAYRLLALREQS
jgi:hypothetical protein